MWKLTPLVLTLCSVMMVCRCGVIYTKPQTQSLGQGRVSILLELSKQVVALQAKTFTTWLEVKYKVYDSKDSVQIKEDVDSDAVLSELYAVDKEVAQVLEKTFKLGIDTSQCMLQVNASKAIFANSKVIQDCRKLISYNTIESKLLELLGIPAGTASIVPKCTLFHPFNNNNFKKCLQDELNTLDTKLGTIKTNIEEELNASTNKTLACMDAEDRSLEFGIRNIFVDFNECITKQQKKINSFQKFSV